MAIASMASRDYHGSMSRSTVGPHDATPRRFRPKVVYAETYRAPGLRVLAEQLPTLPSAIGHVVASAYILKAGAVTIEGTAFEFQDVRIYLARRPESEPT